LLGGTHDLITGRAKLQSLLSPSKLGEGEAAEIALAIVTGTAELTVIEELKFPQLAVGASSR
jgi:hypothetical protein